VRRSSVTYGDTNLAARKFQLGRLGGVAATDYVDELVGFMGLARMSNRVALLAGLLEEVGDDGLRHPNILQNIFVGIYCWRCLDRFRDCTGHGQFLTRCVAHLYPFQFTTCVVAHFCCGTARKHSGFSAVTICWPPGGGFVV
jgi:hypothetical protein